MSPSPRTTESGFLDDLPQQQRLAAPEEHRERQQRPEGDDPGSLPSPRRANGQEGQRACRQKAEQETPGDEHADDQAELEIAGADQQKAGQDQAAQPTAAALQRMILRPP